MDICRNCGKVLLICGCLAQLSQVEQPVYIANWTLYHVDDGQQNIAGGDFSHWPDMKMILTADSSSATATTSVPPLPPDLD